MLLTDLVNGVLQLFFAFAVAGGSLKEFELLLGGLGGEVGDSEADQADGVLEGDGVEEFGGQGLEFVFEAGGPGEYIITGIEPVAGVAPSPAATAAGHGGH